MTNGKKALSLIPKNQRMAIKPPNPFTAVTQSVHSPKQNIIHGNTLFGPYFLPKMPKNGAVSTYGIKKMDRIVLYYEVPAIPRSFSNPAVLALPRFDLSRLLKRYMSASTGRMRMSNFQTRERSAR